MDHGTAVCQPPCQTPIGSTNHSHAHTHTPGGMLGYGVEEVRFAKQRSVLPHHSQARHLCVCVTVVSVANPLISMPDKRLKHSPPALQPYSTSSALS
jgi:hypothetical protein